MICAAATTTTFLLLLLLLLHLPPVAAPSVCPPPNQTSCALSDGTKLLNLSYPFSSVDGCSPSPSFYLENCSPSSASPPLRWHGFLAAVGFDRRYNRTATKSDFESAAEPYVMGIGWGGPTAARWGGETTSSAAANSSSVYVNVTWIEPTDLMKSSSYRNICNAPSLTAERLNSFLPSPIELDLLGVEGAIVFSDYTRFLLLNCSAAAANATNAAAAAAAAIRLQRNTSFCRAYASRCSKFSDPSSCYQLQLPDNPTTLDLNLSASDLQLQPLPIAPYLTCTHFQMLVQTSFSDSNGGFSDSNGGSLVAEAAPGTPSSVGMLQLILQQDEIRWKLASRCQKCESMNGLCGYDTGGAATCYCPDRLRITWSASNCPTTASTCGTGCLIGISFGVAAFLLAFLLLTCFLCRRRRRLRRLPINKSRNGVHAHNSRSIPTDIIANPSNKLFTKRARNLSTRFGPVHVKEFSYQDLVKATESFGESNMIGDGGFGAVYVGLLKDGRRVAVKRLYHDNFRRMDQFYNEMKILSSFSHPNLVKLYGFCCEDDKDLLLVFEYAAKGTVWDQLHGGGGAAAAAALPWPIRLRIACETAEALSYLHNVVKPPIYHRDVKTSNILLDECMRVKVADFGLSRLVPLNVTHVTTAPQGSPGYVDPDYHKCYQLTDKSDVYSFGVVMVELVSGQLAVDMERQRGEINLSSLALSKIGSGQWKDLVDPSLNIWSSPDDDDSSVKMVKAVLELAFICLQEEKDDRPSMKDVSESLSNICRIGGFQYFSTSFEIDGNSYGFAPSTEPPSSEASSLFGKENDIISFH